METGSGTGLGIPAESQSQFVQERSIMKQSGFIIILIMLSFNFSFGQSIVTSNKLWNNFIDIYTPMPYPTYGIEHIKFTDDTLINSVTYKKVKRSFEEDILTWSSYGFIRENANKQIYYKTSVADTERLLYDLNAQLHDTVPVYGLTTHGNGQGSQLAITFFVHHIDSMLIGQTYHKRINLTTLNDTTIIYERWIDSLGSMHGMLHTYWWPFVGFDSYSLLCFFEDGILQFGDSSSTECDYPTGIPEIDVPGPTVTIFPNPVSGISTLEINGVQENNSITVCFYNSFGVAFFRRSGANRIKISNDNLPSGIYFYEVTSKNLVIGTGKIIIN
jgi:hypothetical protein